MDKKQLHDLICQVTAKLPCKTSEEAVNLLLGTAAQESGMGHYIRQLGQGPARGIFQMEPATERDIWDNYLRFKQEIKQAVIDITGRSGPGPWLEWDLAYQIVMARLHYLRVKPPIPSDLEGQARYWKQYYNTVAGSGTVAEYLKNYSNKVM